jgi:hypothetical protein
MVAKKFEVSEKRALFLANKKMAVSAPLLTWLTIHGNICLALRHPANRGDSRQYAIAFVKQLGQALVKEGAISQEELEEIEKLEIEEGSTDIGGV